MPLYDYRCAGCGRTFEALLDRWDAPSPACPECGAIRTERQLAVFSVSGAGMSGSNPESSAAMGPCGSDHCACRSRN